MRCQTSNAFSRFYLPTGPTGPSITGPIGPIGLVGQTGPKGESITGPTGPSSGSNSTNLYRAVYNIDRFTGGPSEYSCYLSKISESSPTTIQHPGNFTLFAGRFLIFYSIVGFAIQSDPVKCYLTNSSNSQQILKSQSVVQVLNQDQFCITFQFIFNVLSTDEYILNITNSDPSDPNQPSGLGGNLPSNPINFGGSLTITEF